MSTALTAPPNNTGVAAPRDIRAMLASDRVKSQITLALPKHMTADRMVRVGLTALNKNPRLLDCTQESILSCFMQCSQYGLEPDGRHAHLIAYGTTCTLIIDYKGLVTLVRRSGEVNDIYADVVCENDSFGFTKGRNRTLTHTFDLRRPRGAVIGAYSYVVPKVGDDSFEIMSTDEIEGIRMRSRSPNAGPWKTDWNEMAKKTVFRRHSKWLPFSPDVQDAINSESDLELEVAPAPRNAKPVFESAPQRAIAAPAEDPPPADDPPPPPPPPPPARAPRTPKATPSTHVAPPPVTAAPPPTSIVHTPREVLEAAGVAPGDFCDWAFGAGRADMARDWYHMEGDISVYSYDDVPAEFWQTLEMDPAAVGKCITIYGKKTPPPAPQGAV